MYTNQDWIKAISNLMRRTSRGEISWSIYPISSEELPNPRDRPTRAYLTTFGGKHYKIFAYQEQNFDGETESFYWVNRFGFSIHDEFEGPIAEAPELPVLSDLFNTVQRKVAYDAKALDGLL